MAKPFYELVSRARDATCFRCSGELDDLCASGFAPGSGAVQGFCCACRMATYFDVTASDNDNDDEQADALACAVVQAWRE